MVSSHDHVNPNRVSEFYKVKQALDGGSESCTQFFSL